MRGSCPKNAILCPNYYIKLNALKIGMEKLAPIIPLIILTSFIIYLGIKKRNPSNIFHLDYIIIHLMILVIMSLIYLGMINSVFPFSFFNILNQLHIASIIGFILHVESAIRGYKIRVKKIFFYYFFLHLTIIILNVLDIQFINTETKVQTFMLINIENGKDYTDKIIIKGITLILLVWYLIKMCASNINKSLTIKKKRIYKLWVYSYCSFIVIQLTINNLYYFGAFKNDYIETINIIVRINAIITLLFIFINPTILNYLPIIKKINVYNNLSKENYFKILVRLMEDDRIYLKKRLNIEEVSIKVGISIKKLRETITLNSGKSFNEFINEYRIERSKRLIKRGYLNLHTTTALGEKCGFNSHQTFFRAFKKNTKMTPIVFLERIDQKR